MFPQSRQRRSPIVGSVDLRHSAAHRPRLTLLLTKTKLPNRLMLPILRLACQTSVLAFTCKEDHLIARG